MGNCLICEKYMFENHICLPSWQIFHEDYLGDESKTIYAEDAEEAAEQYGQYYDNRNGHSLLDEEEIVITVVDVDGGREKFSVTVEIIKQYFATIIP